MQWGVLLNSLLSCLKICVIAQMWVIKGTFISFWVKSVAGNYLSYVGLLSKPENWQLTADGNQSATVPYIDVLRIYDYWSATLQNSSAHGKQNIHKNLYSCTSLTLHSENI